MGARLARSRSESRPESHLVSAPEASTADGLYQHSLRPDWGVAVLAHEGDGKRHYLFQDGCRRALAQGFDALMTRIAQPSPEQHATFARLSKLAVTRPLHERSEGVSSGTDDFETRLTRLHRLFPAGLSDPKWVHDFRTTGVGSALGRDAAVESARTQLSTQKLDALLSARRPEEAWELALSVLRESGLLRPAHLKLRAPSGEPLHELVVALRGLLSEEGPYAPRFDRYLRALAAALGKAPSWELATATPALFFARDQVYVELANFRRLVKAGKTRHAIPQQPSGAAYAVTLGLARSLARKLTEHGDAPRDFLDVRDFMTLTAVVTAPNA